MNNWQHLRAPRKASVIPRRNAYKAAVAIGGTAVIWPRGIDCNTTALGKVGLKVCEAMASCARLADVLCQAGSRPLQCVLCGSPGSHPSPGLRPVGASCTLAIEAKILAACIIGMWCILHKPCFGEFETAGAQTRHQISNNI